MSGFAINSGVYFVHRPDGLVKIGYSSDVQRRMVELRRRFQCELTLLAVIPGDRDLERDLHDEHRDARRVGEWFDFDADPWLWSIAGIWGNIGRGIAEYQELHGA